jgi:hypothetical protein
VGLGVMHGQFVGHIVRFSQRESAFDRAWIFGRHGRTDLSADGLLSDPSVFAPLPENLTGGLRPPVEKGTAQTAQSFANQLKAAARKLPAAQQGSEDSAER